MLRKNGFLTFGVERQAGRFEWDKHFAREEMVRYGAQKCLPPFRAFRSPQAGLRYVKQRFSDGFEGRLFIKAAFPALGKGVWPVTNIDEVVEAMEGLILLPNQAGRVFLVEDEVGGPQAEEFSGYFLGHNFAEFGYFQDHKRVFDQDRGPNTGGMGSVGPISLITPELDLKVKEEVVKPLSCSLKDRGLSYPGFLYVGGMYDSETEQIFLIEFNTRNGGSEAATNIPGLVSDYHELVRSVTLGLDIKMPLEIKRDGKVRVAVAGTALGYPGDYKQVIGRKVEGLEEVIKKGEVMVLGAGIDNEYRVLGGRIFWLVGVGNNVEQAIRIVYKNMANLYIPGNKRGENLLHYRCDIGAKELK